MTDEEFMALQAEVETRNAALAELRAAKDEKAAAVEVELEELRVQIRALQAETDPLETKLREEDSRRAGREMDTIGLGG